MDVWETLFLQKVFFTLLSIRNHLKKNKGGGWMIDRFIPGFRAYRNVNERLSFAGRLIRTRSPTLYLK